LSSGSSTESQAIGFHEVCRDGKRTVCAQRVKHAYYDVAWIYRTTDSIGIAIHIDKDYPPGRPTRRITI
jgi:hypothetical protein